MVELDFLAPAQIMVGAHQQSLDVRIGVSTGDAPDAEDYLNVALLLPVRKTKLGSKQRTVLAEENRVPRNERDLGVWLETVASAVGVTLDREQNRLIRTKR